MILRTRCKAGKLEITDDGTIRVIQLFHRVVWQARTQDVKGFSTSPGTLASVNVTIYTGNDTFVAETMTRSNYEALQACFPRLPRTPIGQAWYMNAVMRSHTATYDHAMQMQQEKNAAAMNGWMIVGQNIVGKHMVVTYGRTPQWLTQHA